VLAGDPACSSDGSAAGTPSRRPPAQVDHHTWIWSLADGVKLVKLQLTEATSPATKLVRLTIRASGGLQAARQQGEGEHGAVASRPSLHPCSACCDDRALIHTLQDSMLQLT
jgi:hypothetical protein